MSSASGKEQFMRQFDAIVEGVKQNKVKVSNRYIEISNLRVTHPCTRPGAGWLMCTHGQVQDG
jgi:hypothetical protein